MEFKIIKLKGYLSKSKHVLLVDGEPIIVTNNPRRASECMAYIQGYDMGIEDKKVKRILERYKAKEEF